MRTLPDGCVQTCVTSPPYYGLRDYGHAGQIGLEPTPAEYVARLVEVFREVRRVLRDDGTVWLNLGDSYWGGKGENGSSKARATAAVRGYVQSGGTVQMNKRPQDGTHPIIKPKDLIGIPWRVAFALQADGWYLRQDIIWAKPNPMPESVRDRCTKAHEYVFLLAKRERYYYDADAVNEPAATTGKINLGFSSERAASMGRKASGNELTGGRDSVRGDTRNRRSVWTITPKPFKGAHFAVMPPELVRPCIRAGSKPGDTVLDPFGGSGTVAAVAIEEGRQAILCELNPEYCAIATARIEAVQPVAHKVAKSRKKEPRRQHPNLFSEYL